ncbi:hypothetical protein SOVF_112020 isoform B, partial [Spinacia oleracea]
ITPKAQTFANAPSLEKHMLSITNLQAVGISSETSKRKHWVNEFHFDEISLLHQSTAGSIFLYPPHLTSPSTCRGSCCGEATVGPKRFRYRKASWPRKVWSCLLC